MARLEIQHPVHLLFAFDPEFTMACLDNLLSTLKKGTIFLYTDRSYRFDETDPMNIQKYKKEVKEKLSDLDNRLYFLKGDSRYPNLGLEIETWKKILPLVDKIWMLPALAAIDSFNLHSNFMSLYQEIYGVFESPASIASSYIGPEYLKREFSEMGTDLK